MLRRRWKIGRNKESFRYLIEVVPRFYILKVEISLVSSFNLLQTPYRTQAVG